MQKTLDDLIEEALVRQQAEKEGVLLSEEEIDKKRADFAALAREKSEDAGTREEGGIYRFSPEQKMTDPEFSRAAQKLKVGAVIMASKESGVKMGDLELKLAETAAGFLAKQMEQ